MVSCPVHGAIVNVTIRNEKLSFGILACEAAYSFLGLACILPKIQTEKCDAPTRGKRHNALLRSRLDNVIRDSVVDGAVA